MSIIPESLLGAAGGIAAVDAGLMQATPDKAMGLAIGAALFMMVDELTSKPTEL